MKHAGEHKKIMLSNVESSEFPGAYTKTEWKVNYHLSNPEIDRRTQWTTQAATRFWIPETVGSGDLTEISPDKNFGRLRTDINQFHGLNLICSLYLNKIQWKPFKSEM